jgi:hypothetical protein
MLMPDPTHFGAPDARARHAALPQSLHDAHANWISVMYPMRHATLPYSSGVPVPMSGMPPSCMSAAGFAGYGQFGMLYPMTESHGHRERLSSLLPQHAAGMAAGMMLMPSPILGMAPLMRSSMTASEQESAASSGSQPWWQYHSQAARIAGPPLYPAGMYPRTLRR